MALVIGIDASTTATKAFLIDVTGAVRGVGTAEYGFEVARPLWSEQSPALWLDGAVASIQSVLARTDVHGTDVAAVGLTGQMHGLVLLDDEGEVLRPAILWNDQGTGAECDVVRRAVGPERLIELTGNDALRGFTAPKLVWVRDHDQLLALLAGKNSDGYASKFEQHADQAGTAPLGFRRTAEPPHTLEIDPASIDQAVMLFERYAVGRASRGNWPRTAASSSNASGRSCKTRSTTAGCGVIAARMKSGSQRPGAPIPRCRTNYGGRSRRCAAPRPKAAVLETTGGSTSSLACSNASAADTRAVTADLPTVSIASATPIRARTGGPHERLADRTWEVPLLAQLADMHLDDATVAQVVAVLGRAEAPVSLDRARLERHKRELALDHAAERIGDDAYLARSGQLRSEIAALDQQRGGTVTATRAVEWLRVIGQAIRSADVPEARAELVHAIYERLVVAGPQIVEAHLTPTALAHGLALALPEVAKASPAGFEPATGRLEGGCSSPLSYGDP